MAHFWTSNSAYHGCVLESQYDRLTSLEKRLVEENSAFAKPLQGSFISSRPCSVHQHILHVCNKAKRVSELLKANQAKVIVGSGSSRRIKVAPMFRLASLFCQNLNGPFLNLEFSLSWMRAFISHNAINLPRWRNGYSKKTNSSSSICSYVKFLVPLLRDNVVWIQSQRRPCERSPPPPWLPVLRSRHAAILSSLDACIILWLCHQVFETQWWRTNILEKPKKVSCCCCCCWRPTKRKLITEMRFFRHDESGSN